MNTEMRNTDPADFSIGPSNIRRLSKWRNRFKKAAQHKQNLVERAARNSGRTVKK